MDLSKASLDQLRKELLRQENCQKMPKRNLILLGPPGSGKGTQSRFLINDFCFCHIATGDLLREAVSKQSQSGLKAKEAMDKGLLVSDEIVNEIIIDELRSPQCSRGIIFHGYPRNQDQAENLEKLLESEGKKLDHVIDLKMDEDQLIVRVEGRKVHPESGRTYHEKYNPPKIAGRDDVTGEPLIHRDDDNKEILRTRLENYNLKTRPIYEFYNRKRILYTVDAMKRLDDVRSDIKKLLI